MKYLQTLTNTWLNKRIPAANQHSLDHTKIFIFPSRFGGLFLLLCMLLFLLGTNYQNNLMLLLCYFLLALFLINLLASYINFARIHLQQGKSSQVFVGDNLPLPMWLNIDNKQKKPINGLLYFSFFCIKKDHQAHHHPVSKIDSNAYSNPITLGYTCERRGKLVLPRVTVSSYYPLGLFRCWTHLAFNNEIIIYPRPLPCSVQLVNRSQSNDENSADQIIEQTGYDDFSHLKSYQAGEPLHHVAWKQLAKGRGMVSKHFASNAQQTGWLKLTTHSRQNDATQVEKDISQLTYQVIELSRQQLVFGLDLGANCIAPNSGAAHQNACLKALALYPNGDA